MPVGLLSSQSQLHQLLLLLLHDHHLLLPILLVLLLLEWKSFLVSLISDGVQRQVSVKK
jgi:hypothetical protein